MNEEQERDAIRWQRAIADYRDELMEIARSSPMHTGSRIDHANRELIVIGVGEPTEALANAIRRAPESLRVTWQKAPFTAAELITETLRIMSEQPERVNGGGALNDGSGIHFETTDQTLLAASDPQAALGARYPVTVEYGGPAVPV